ncbi:hypothetical protein [Fibrobacter sp. UBA2449]|uniref:hypothetical protein n=1 Tax=Fibrobacter sp. UBA2449 TaxID=1946529 RepID=UPI0025BCFBE1|nr:hypothetical protein [Fibrobacter sp. UBA2449]
MDTEQLLKIYRAVAGPVAENNVDKALRIIRNGGKMPPCLMKSEIRTYFRVKERLAEHGLI